MSVPVDLSELEDRIDGYGFAYLITVGENQHAHLVAVTPAVGAGGIAVGGLGRTSVANVTANPAVTLVWPPRDAGGYSLIVDGSAVGGDGQVTVTPTKAILHRPAIAADGTRVGNDCQPIDSEVPGST